MARSKKKLGDILVERKVLTSEDLEKANSMAKGSGKRLGQVIVEAEMASEDDVAKAMAEQFGMEYLDLSNSDVANRIDRSLIPDDLIKKHHVLPLEKSGGRLKLIIHDPMDLQLLDMLRFRLNMEIDAKLASHEQIKQYIESGATGVKQVAEGESLVTESIDRSVDATVDRSVDRSVDSSIDITDDHSPIVRLVNRILIEAERMRASDIHIEPMGDRVRLRYRIDGVCVERDNLPIRMKNSLTSRIKLMAGMNIAEKRLPQDGRIKLPLKDSVIDFRVSACPMYHGESVVLRILRPEAVKIGLENLGFETDNLTTFNRIIRRPTGIFLVTGPTGSGKTTTLYSALDVLNRPDRKIITAEDPVEYNFTGINQCQVRDRIGLTFSAILRSMLRQAPNVILVGEIRDKEVGEIAIQAALTGHLVFSTLHTNDAPSAITRLTDMGIKPFLVASSIQAVMAQRLIRLLCAQCRQPDPSPDPKYLRLIGCTQEEAEGRVYGPQGCEACNRTGYRGRKAIFEMMQMNGQIRDLAFNKATLDQIRAAALASGMRPLVADGKIKVLRGETTPAEISRVTQVSEVLEEAEVAEAG